MSTNLDLEDPTLTVVNFLDANFSTVPVTVITGALRGGYSRGKPRILPVEGKEGRRRIAEIQVHQEPTKTIIYVYEASYNETKKDLPNDYYSAEARVSIDMRTAISRAMLQTLDNEVKRICSKFLKITPGGNWSHIMFVDRKNLTDRKAGLFRIVRDIYLLEGTRYYGHQ